MVWQIASARCLQQTSRPRSGCPHHRRLSAVAARPAHLSWSRGIGWPAVLASVLWLLAVGSIFAQPPATVPAPPATPEAKQPAESVTPEAKQSPDSPPARSEHPKSAEAAPAARSQDPEVAYVRLRRGDDKQPLALETAVTRFVPVTPGKDAPTVDLIGAVHVGEKAYYEQLNKLFTEYDAVLYELVAAGPAPKPTGQPQRSRHPVTMLQTVMKDVLELEFQLDHIDYSRKNMVHADMSPSEFAQSMKDRGESFLQMFFRMMRHAMTVQSGRSNAPNEMQLLVALFSRDRSMKLKRLLAEQFQDVEQQLAALSGPDGSTIITERNKKALSVLDRELKEGKRRIAIFYGAGHLSDFAERLQRDYQLKQASQTWLTAWSLSDKPTAAADSPSATTNPATTDAPSSQP